MAASPSSWRFGALAPLLGFCFYGVACGSSRDDDAINGGVPGAGTGGTSASGGSTSGSAGRATTTGGSVSSGGSGGKSSSGGVAGRVASTGGSSANGTGGSSAGRVASSGGSSNAGEGGGDGPPSPGPDGSSPYERECHGDTVECVDVEALRCLGIRDDSTIFGYSCSNTCETDAECSDAPSSGEAKAACVDFVTQKHCLLVCLSQGAMKSCPEGMGCYVYPESPIGYCLWQ
jgi:hypothetical protein